MASGVKIVWTKKMDRFLRKNFQTMSNPDLAKALGMRLTALRSHCYDLGLRKMEMEYWTPEMIRFLRARYQKIGDVELAEIFTKKWHKAKGWSNKHIEKKRRYLGLKRTEAEKDAIKQRNLKNGRFAMCSTNMWKTRGVMKDGTIREYLMKDGRIEIMIKHNGKLVLWRRWYWEKLRGPIPKGMVVVWVDSVSRKRSIKNLQLISFADNARRNGKKSVVGLSDNYIAGIMSHNDPELREVIKENKSLISIKRKQLQLNRTINEKAREKAGKHEG